LIVFVAFRFQRYKWTFHELLAFMRIIAMSKKTKKNLVSSLLLLVSSAFINPASASPDPSFFCYNLTAISDNGDPIDSFTFKLGFLGFSRPVSGTACILYTGDPDLGIYNECYPVSGSFVSYGGEIKGSLKGSVESEDYGLTISTFGDYQLSLNSTGLKGSYSANMTTFVPRVDLALPPKMITNRHTGTLSNIACP